MSLLCVQLIIFSCLRSCLVIVQKLARCSVSTCSVARISDHLVDGAPATPPPASQFTGSEPNLPDSGFYFRFLWKQGHPDEFLEFCF